MGRGGLRPDCGGAIQAWPENAGFWGRTFLDLTNDTQNLRNHLRHATAKAHDALDRSMADFDLSDRRSYAGFLTVQLAARAPIEEWCAAQVPEEFRPPAQAPLIRADLADLGISAEREAVAPARELTEPLGVAWTLGGSSLGNRAMLAHLRKRTGADWPTAFLADPRMAQFWSALRPRIEQPTDSATASRAAASALAVFARFEAALADHGEREAA